MILRETIHQCHPVMISNRVDGRRKYRGSSDCRCLEDASGKLPTTIKSIDVESGGSDPSYYRAPVTFDFDSAVHLKY